MDKLNEHAAGVRWPDLALRSARTAVDHHADDADRAAAIDALAEPESCPHRSEGFAEDLDESYRSG